VVPHPDHQNRAAPLVEPTISVLARGVDLRDDLLTLRNLVRSVVLIPLDPVFPHLNDLLPLELPGNAESSDSIDIGVEVLLVLELGVVRPE